ncbi:hypothetical protein [Candidatus Burkholderia verschuerenii]|uniref:hypothetical protein n=1 Tax=Candidatus Burkholderia verschuerenii TaxID=242163 RepID=UPI0018DD615C|nr:hypothetical protein [Candidatus Burkholderia verschuerenii]
MFIITRSCPSGGTAPSTWGTLSYAPGCAALQCSHQSLQKRVRPRCDAGLP